MTEYIFPEVEPVCYNLRKYRRQRHITQDHLAFLIGCNRTYISALECGRINPTLLTLVNLARELGIETCYLLINTKKYGEVDLY